MLQMTRRQGAALAVIMSGLMVLTGCGGAASTAVPVATKAPAVTAAAGATSTPTAVVAASPNCGGPCTPKQGGTFSRFQSADPPSWNPFGNSLATTHDQKNLTNSLLLRHKSIQWPENAPFGAAPLVGEMASSWEVSGVGTIWTLHMRQGVKWPNIAPMNGRPLVAQDAVYTFLRARDNPQSVFRAYFDDLLSISAPDSSTVVETLKTPFAEWGNIISLGETPGIVAQDFIEMKGTDYGVSQDSMVGTGPFLASGGQRSSQWLYTRNPTYYQPGIPHVDAFRFVIIADAAAQEAAFVTGQLDTLNVAAPAPANAARIKGAVGDAVLFVGAGFSGTDGGFIMNQGGGIANQAGAGGATGNPAFKDVRVRQAMRYLFPYQRLMSDYYTPAANPHLGSCIANATVGFTLSQDELATLYVYDPAKAKDLLTQAGYSNAHKLAFELIEATPASNAPVYDAIKAETDATGMIDMTITPIPVAQARAKLLKGTFDVEIQPMGSGGPDKVFAPFRTGASQNYAEWSDPKVDAWYDDQRVQQDPVKRAQEFHDFGVYCAQQVPIIPNISSATFQIQRGWLKNYGIRDEIWQDEEREMWVWIDKSGS